MILVAQDKRSSGDRGKGTGKATRHGDRPGNDRGIGPQGAGDR